MVLFFGRVSSNFLIVFDGVGMNALLARVHIGRVSCGLASGLGLFSSLSPSGPRASSGSRTAGLVDGPECRGKAEQPSWHTAADKHHPPGHLQPYFWPVETKLGPCRTHFWVHRSFPPKSMCFVTRLKTDFVSLNSNTRSPFHVSFWVIVGTQHRVWGPTSAAHVHKGR